MAFLLVAFILNMFVILTAAITFFMAINAGETNFVLILSLIVLIHVDLSMFKYRIWKSNQENGPFV